jgi:hypothetical protein
MTNEERDLIAKFIERVAGGPAASGGFTGSVPSTTAAPTLPPIDRDADAHLAELFQRFPEARYRISQLAYVQEQALNQAANRISGLEAELNRARQAQQQQAPQPSPWGTPMAASAPSPQAESRGFFGSLFGGGRQAQPQQPQYAPPPYQQPQYQQPTYQQPPQQTGMLQSGGSGFFGSALTTAAGVAGGMVAGNALMNLFSGHHGGFGGGYEGGYGGFGGGGFGSEAAYAPPVEYVPVAPEAQPWGAPPSGIDPYDVGGAAKSDPGYVDNSGWTDTGSTDSGWTDTSDSTDSGWTDTSNDT